MAQELIETDPVAFTGEKYLVYMGDAHVVLFQQQPAVDRVLNVGRVESFSEHRSKVKEFGAFHEYEPAEFHPDVNDRGNFIGRKPVIRSRDIHEGNVGTFDKRNLRKSFPEKRLDIFKSMK